MLLTLNEMIDPPVIVTFLKIQETKTISKTEYLAYLHIPYTSSNLRSGTAGEGDAWCFWVDNQRPL